MVAIIVTLVASFVLSELVGYLYHRLAHVPGTVLYRAHMVHHLKAYPHTDFSSEGSYRGMGSDSFTFWFLPIYFGALLIEYLMLPLGLALAAAVATSFAGLMNIYAHEAIHVTTFRFSKMFKTAAMLHYVHHRNMKKNFGIYFFLWDRVFGTIKLPRIET